MLSASVGQIKDPDFSQILSEFRAQVQLQREVSNEIFSLSNGIKNFVDSSNKIESIPEKEPSSFVDYMWLEIRKMKESNSLLQRVHEHLRETVGS